MKKTRNLFVLTGYEHDVHTALEHIKFKGVTVLADDHVTRQAISEVLANNKSAVCTNCPPAPATTPILVNVVNDNASDYAEN